jgi:hypothetical protein
MAFGTEHDHLDVMIGRDRQPRAGGWVEPPLEHVTFNNQRACNTTLNRALAFGTNIDEHRLTPEHILESEIFVCQFLPIADQIGYSCTESTPSSETSFIPRPGSKYFLMVEHAVEKQILHCLAVDEAGNRSRPRP